MILPSPRSQVPAQNSITQSWNRTTTEQKAQVKSLLYLSVNAIDTKSKSQNYHEDSFDMEDERDQSSSKMIIVTLLTVKPKGRNHKAVKVFYKRLPLMIKRVRKYKLVTNCALPLTIIIGTKSARKSIITKSSKKEANQPEEQKTLLWSKAKINQEAKEFVIEAETKNPERRHNTFKGNWMIRGYMETIISKTNQKTVFFCQLCQQLGFLENLLSHLKSVKHKNNTPPVDHQKLEELAKELSDHLKKGTKTQEDIEENKDSIERLDKEVRASEDSVAAANYLKFIRFTVSEKYSFEATTRLGKFLSDMNKNDGLEFFEEKIFDSEEISKTVRNLAKPLNKDLQNDLKNSYFSLSLDSTTLAGENICAIRIRYLKESVTEHNITKTEIKNKLLSICTLKASSTGEDYHNLLLRKLSDLGDDVKQNFIALVTDRGPSLVGKNIGLAALIKKEYPNLYILPDPCHSLHHVLEKSYKTLSTEIQDFVREIHTHFSSSQRKSLLQEIQQNMLLDSPKALLKNFIDTRWLSMGESIERILYIWDSLQLYMETINKDDNYKKLTTKESKVLEALLDSQLFRCKMLLLSKIIEKLNEINKIFQSQTLPFDTIKAQIKLLWKSISRLFLNEKKLISEETDSVSLDWKSKTIQKKYFLPKIDFFKSLPANVDQALNYLNTSVITESKRTEFYEEFTGFLANILQYSKKYLPYQDAIVDASDFLTCDEYKIGKPLDLVLIGKIAVINSHLNIIPKEDIPSLNAEIINITTMGNLSALVQSSNGDSLDLWDRILTRFRKEQIPNLSKIWLAMHALPTSSADVEQGFSTMKMVKTDLRNRLKEETLEAILILNQNKDAPVTQEMIDIYKNVISELSNRKRGKKGGEFDPNSKSKKRKRDSSNVNSGAKTASADSQLVDNTQTSQVIMTGIKDNKLTSDVKINLDCNDLLDYKPSEKETKTESKEEQEAEILIEFFFFFFFFFLTQYMLHTFIFICKCTPP